MFTTAFLKLTQALIGITFTSDVIAGCDRTYTVTSYGETCSSIAQNNDVSNWQLTCLNPWIDSTCSNLHPGNELCLGAIGHDCKITHNVAPGDFCYKIVDQYKIPLDTFYANNPNIHNPKCDNLPAGGAVCVGPHSYYKDFTCPVGLV